MEDGTHACQGRVGVSPSDQVFHFKPVLTPSSTDFRPSEARERPWAAPRPTSPAIGLQGSGLR